MKTLKFLLIIVTLIIAQLSCSTNFSKETKAQRHKETNCQDHNFGKETKAQRH